MLSARAIKMRSAALGSSDIPAVVELDEHRGPLDVWMDKVGLGARKETAPMVAGQELEAPIGRIYCRMTGARIRSGGGTVRHRKHAWAVANIDRRVDGAAVDLVEIKNVGTWQARAWRHGPPAGKLVQVLWQLEVAGLRRAHIAALLGGTEFRIYTVEHDAELVAMLLDAGSDFMRDHVTPALEARAAAEEDWTRFAPPHTPDEGVEIADAQFPESNGTVLPCTPEARAIHRELIAADADRKAAKARWDAAEAAAKKMLGKAEEIAGCFTWKHDEVGKVAWAQVAKALSPTQELIDKHTGAPPRRFLLKGRDHG